MGWEGWITIAVFAFVFVALVREVFSPDIVLLVGASVLVILGIITPAQFLSGFSRQIVFIFAMLFIIVRSIYISGVLSLFAKKALPNRGGYRQQLFALMAPISLVSAFLNNTPIVLMATGVVREWAVRHNKIPSKFLIPISYAAIFGGMCTLIGTASNLIVDGLLRQASLQAGFGFFELALIGLPALVLGYLYLLSFGPFLLPERREPMGAAVGEMREFTSEFRVLSSFAGKRVRQLKEAYLISILRGGQEISSPSPDEMLLTDDRLVFAGDIEQFAKLTALEGLESLHDKEFQLDPSSSHVAEVVVAVGSSLVGKHLKGANFRTVYGASVVAIYRQGKRLEGSLSELPLIAGDTLLLLANHPWKLPNSRKSDLYSIKDSQRLPILVPKRAILVCAVLISMVVSIILGFPLLYATLGAAGILLFSRSISFKEAARGIDWHLLLLVATAFPFGTALMSTGVADLLAKGVLYIVGTTPHLLIGGLFLLTMVVTEFVTNTASALLLFPIAVETVRIAGYDTLSALKAVGVTIAIAATSSFLTPIGYQTNTIVYGPGGYKFFDYARVGFGLTLLQLLLASWLIPLLWPLLLK